MKANELQIGDYFMLNGSVVIVEEISAKGWVHITDPETGCRIGMTTDYILDCLQPIPLTLKILEHNGFEWMDDDLNPDWYRWEECKQNGYNQDWWTINYEMETNYLHVMNESCNKTMYEMSGVFKHVHELQHLLRMCKIDKEIIIAQ